jgi:hypothetical protein
MKGKWLQLCVYAAVSVIGLGLDLFRPDVKAVLCNPLNLGGRDNGLDQTSGHHAAPTRQQPDL